VRQGLSQADLAGDTLSPSAVSLLESGRREPTPRTLEILAHRLGCTVEYLRDGVSPEAGALGILRMLRAELALRSGSAEEADAILREGGGPAACGDALPMQRLRYIQALAKEELGAPDEAVRMLEELLATTGQDGQWLTLLVALARCYRKTGQITRSIETADFALTRMADLGAVGIGEQAETRATLMLALDEAGMLAEAMVHARRNLEAGPMPSWTQRARIYDHASRRAEESGRLVEAVWLAERGVGLLSAGEDEVMLARLRAISASTLMRGGQVDLSDIVSTLTESHDVLRVHASPIEVGRCEVELARAMLLSGSAQAAATWAESAITHLDGSPAMLCLAWGRLMLGRSLLALMRAEPALVQAHEATVLLRTAPNSVRTAEAWREAGELLRELHQEAAALDALSQALAAVGVGSR
jgi:transcriptional regulator with XRE-family HTH domain